MCESFRVVCFWLTCAVSSVGSVGYSLYLIGLLAHLKGSIYGLFVLVPLILTIFMLGFEIRFRKNGPDYIMICVSLTMSSLLPTLLCTFTMLTRLSYYHLSPEETIGPKFVLMSLKGCIIFFISAALAEKKCQFKEILKDKNTFSRGLPLDFVDVFDMLEILSLGDNHLDAGNDVAVPELSSLEIAIQAFCIVALFTMHFINYRLHRKYFGIDVSFNCSDTSESESDLESWTQFTLTTCAFLLNFPFLMIRVVVLGKYREFHLGFIVKNVMGILVSVAPLLEFEWRDNCDCC